MSQLPSTPKAFKFNTITTMSFSIVFLCLLISQLGFLKSVASTLADFDGATFYKAPIGSRVRIACNGSHWSEDSVSLVLWFKGSSQEHHSVPIYTVDARQKPLNGGARHFIADAYKGRAKFVTRSWPPYLDLSPLEEEDQAEYRCRIDYRSKPRENFLIILFVLVPPKSVQIVDSEGRALGQIYGPLSESSDLTLACLSKGGRPPPAISWIWRHKVIDDSYLTLNDFQALKYAGQLLSTVANGSLTTSYNPASFPDKNRQKSENPINANPSFGPLAGLFRLWRSWPEFDFFNSNRRNNSIELELLQSHRKSEPPPGSFGFSQSLPTPLLNMNVHESITTSVNLLKLANLGSMFAASGEIQPEPEVEPGAKARMLGMPTLECHASNLHYDLKSLIKLFAPASLQTLNGSHHQPLVKPAAHNANSGVEPIDAKQRQLETAIEGAIEFGLAVGASSAPSDVSDSRATALKQIKHDAAGGPLVTVNSSSLPNSIRNFDDPEDEGDAAKLIYQQLFRPHQLSGLAALEEPANASHHQFNAALVRGQLIALDVYLRPAEVKITTGQRPLPAGQLAEFACSARGSRPPARLSWWMNGLQIDSSQWRQIDESNASHTRLSIQLEPKDNGAQLACRAENEQLLRLDAERQKIDSTGSTSVGQLEDSRSLMVHYAPRVKLELGNKILSSAIREGTDIYFVCQVDSVPPVRDITWMHNDKPIESGAISSVSGESGQTGSGLIIASNNSLVLQRVRIAQKGQYACMAFNSEGGGESNRIELRVLHAPICALPSSRSGELLLSRPMSMHTKARFLCQMEAEPASDLEISWYLNNSRSDRKPLSVGDAGDGELQPQTNAPLATSARPRTDNNAADNNNESQRSVLGNGADLNGMPRGPVSSQLNYSVESTSDYGRLYCVAKNSIGEQKRPCIYEIKPLDQQTSELAITVPGQLSCLPVKVTSTSVWIGCERPLQTAAGSSFAFSVEVYRQQDKSASTKATSGDEPDEGSFAGRPEEDQKVAGLLEARLASLSLSEPLFSINNLRPSTSYNIRVQSGDVFEEARPSFVRFTTFQGEPVGTTSGRPTIEAIVEPHSTNSLMSAFISTRSTNGQHSEFGLPTNSRFGKQDGQQHQRRFPDKPESTGFVRSLWDSIVGSSLIQTLWSTQHQSSTPAESRRSNHPAGHSDKARQRNQPASNQLMESSEALLVASATLIFAASLTGVLLLYRYSSKACSFQAHSGSTCGSPLDSPERIRNEPASLMLAQTSTSPAINSNSSGTGGGGGGSTSGSSTCGSAGCSSGTSMNAAGPLRQNNAIVTQSTQNQSIRNSGKCNLNCASMLKNGSFQLPAAAAFQRNSLTSLGQRNPAHSNTLEFGRQQRRAKLAPSAAEPGATLPGNGVPSFELGEEIFRRVTRSRSSQCFQQEALVAPDNGEAQRQRLIQLSGIDRHLISDANAARNEQASLLDNNKQAYLPIYSGTTTTTTTNNNNNNNNSSSVSSYLQEEMGHHNQRRSDYKPLTQDNRKSHFHQQHRNRNNDNHYEFQTDNGLDVLIADECSPEQANNNKQLISIVVAANNMSPDEGQGLARFRKKSNNNNNNNNNFIQLCSNGHPDWSSVLSDEQSSDSNHQHRMLSSLSTADASCWLSSQQMPTANGHSTTACNDAQQTLPGDQVHFIELLPSQSIHNTDGSDSTYFTTSDMNIVSKMDFPNSTTPTTISDLTIQRQFVERTQRHANTILCPSITSSSIGSFSIGGPGGAGKEHKGNLSSPLSLTLSTTNTDPLVLHNNHCGNTMRRSNIEQTNCSKLCLNSNQQIQLTSILKNSNSNKSNNQHDNSICQANGSQNTSKDLSQASSEERL